jgi:hypothetical protein
MQNALGRPRVLSAQFHGATDAATELERVGEVDLALEDQLRVNLKSLRHWWSGARDS